MSGENFKVLINTPSFKMDTGGVSNHFLGLSRFLPENRVSFCYTGGLRDYNKLVVIPVYIYQYLKFIYRLISYKPDIVHLNPSLCYDSVIRDGVFVLISKLFKKKAIVFWHGWKVDFEGKIENKYTKIFKRVFNKSDGFIIISSHVIEKLRQWGFKQPVLKTSTKVDDYLIEGFEISKKERSGNILFLGRLEENKGIFEALRAFQLVQKRFPELTLTYAGNGPDKNKLMEIIKREKIFNVFLTGFVRNEEKIRTYMNAGVFILPSYTEGMPTTMLEAMSFGIPVISRPVGGIPDFFINDKMGYLIESKDPADFSDKIIDLYSDKCKWEEISKFNHEYARANFLASHLVFDLMSFYEQIYKR